MLARTVTDAGIKDRHISCLKRQSSKGGHLVEILSEQGQRGSGSGRERDRNLGREDNKGIKIPL